MLDVGGRRKSWDLLFVQAFDLLGYRFSRTVKGIPGTEKTLRKGWEAGGRMGTSAIEKRVLEKEMCSHMLSS